MVVRVGVSWGEFGRNDEVMSSARTRGDDGGGISYGSRGHRVIEVMGVTGRGRRLYLDRYMAVGE